MISRSDGLTQYQVFLSGDLVLTTSNLSAAVAKAHFMQKEEHCDPVSVSVVEHRVVDHPKIGVVTVITNIIGGKHAKSPDRGAAGQAAHQG